MAPNTATINIILPRNLPQGCLKITKKSWSGIIYKIPRESVPECKDIAELKGSGAYMLFGSQNDSRGLINSVYIGQAGQRNNAGGIINRLLEHHNKKEFWEEAIVILTTNNDLGYTELGYLENRLYKLAKDANRFLIVNQREPTIGNIPESIEYEMEDFI